MRNRLTHLLASCVLACGATGAPAWAGDFSGSYKSDKLSIVISPGAGGFGGEIQKGDQHFPIKAHEENGRLVGSFSVGDDTFAFTASADGDLLVLISGGVRYSMRKSADALAGYITVTKTDFGKALSVDKPGAADLKAAFQATFPDLAKYFGERPSIGGVFEDARDHRSGGASFTAHLNGQAIKGLVSCKIGDKGATMAIIYCRSDAPNAEWSKLLAAPAPAAGATVRAADVQLREYQFPDDTGTIGIAAGWTTNSQSLMTGVMIEGPADQKIALAIAASVLTADNPMFQIQRQLELQARQLGAPPPPPPPPSLVAEYTDPATALKALMPQISRMSQASGGPEISIDGIVSVQEVTASLPNGKAAVITYDVTKTSRAGARHYRAGNRFEMTPVGQGTWMLYSSEVSAPRETYDRDLPVMIAMAASLKENPRVIAEKTRINIEAANERFAAQQRANRELIESFDAQNAAWRRRELIQSRSNADFDEVIRGYRTVEDTTTGYRTSVDLGNAHDVVDRLNEFSPGRYKEIPLRDEMYPLTGR